MPVEKLVRTLSRDEAEIEAIHRENHRPSFVKASRVLGAEACEVAKLSEYKTPNRSRRKLFDTLFCVTKKNVYAS